MIDLAAVGIVVVLAFVVGCHEAVVGEVQSGSWLVGLKPFGFQPVGWGLAVWEPDSVWELAVWGLAALGFVDLKAGRTELMGNSTDLPFFPLSSCSWILQS